MCQYACLPAPKMRRDLKLWRRVKRREEERAVRKAVSSSALRNPVGAPVGDMMAITPWGEASAEGFGRPSGRGVARVTTR